MHVKGHQDRVKKTENLTSPEKLNIDADKFACFHPSLALCGYQRAHKCIDAAIW